MSNTRTIHLTLPKFHPAQAKIEQGLKRFNVLDCGRRFGKDIYCMNKIIEPALAGYPVGWFAPSYKMLSEDWRLAKRLLRPIITRPSEQEKQLELASGGLIDFWSLDNPDVSRGRRYKRIVINEAAMVPDLLDAWNHVIRPTLLDYKGDGFFPSTPKGRNGFWQMYQWGEDKLNEEWQSFQYPTYANPYIDPKEIDTMKDTLPERIFRQEILAEFLEDAGGVFRMVMEAATAQEQLTAIEGKQYIAGVDVASLVDFTVVTVFDVEARSMIYMDRFNKVDYNVLEDRLQALYNRFRLDSMVIESNSIGQPVIDALSNRGLSIIPFTTTNITKQAAIQLLQSAFEHSLIKILPDPILIGELQAFEGVRTPSGSFKYSAPEGMHDDCVMSLAIAWQAMEGGNLWLIS